SHESILHSAGKLLFAALYQFEPSTSPPRGVTAAHHVASEVPTDSSRTLPSARATFMPALCGVEARVGSQSVGAGRCWKIEWGPMLDWAHETAKPGCNGCTPGPVTE